MKVLMGGAILFIVYALYRELFARTSQGIQLIMPVEMLGARDYLDKMLYFLLGFKGMLTLSVGFAILGAFVSGWFGIVSYTVVYFAYAREYRMPLHKWVRRITWKHYMRPMLVEVATDRFDAKAIHVVDMILSQDPAYKEQYIVLGQSRAYYDWVFKHTSLMN